MTDDYELARQALSECPLPLRDQEWHYLHRVCNAERACLVGHEQLLMGLAFSPDGRRLVSYGADMKIKLWDVASRQVLWEVRKAAPSCREIAFNHDGTQIIQTVMPGQRYDTNAGVMVWGLDAASGQELWRCQVPGQLDTAILSPDRRFVAVGDQSARVVKLIELPSGRVAASSPLPERTYVHVQAFSPYGSRVAAQLKGDGLLIWDAKSGRQLRRIPFRSNDVCEVAFSADGRRVATAVNVLVRPSYIAVFDVESGDELQRIPLGVLAHLLKASPDGRLLASANLTDRQVFVWDAVTGQERLTLRGHTSGIRCLSFSPDGQMLATGGTDATIRLWDVSLSE